LRNFLHDLRFGARRLIKNPGFSFIAILTLALGVGANTAIFTVVNSVLLRPLPYKEADRLVMVKDTWLPKFPEFAAAPANFLDWRKENTVFERLVAIRRSSMNLTGKGDPEQLIGGAVTEGFFPMLGVAPQLGRDFLPEENQTGKNNVLILDHGFWQKRYGGDPGIINQSISFDGQSYTVIGVLPSTFSFLDGDVAYWTPLAFTPEQAQNRGGHNLGRVVGRLKPGVTLEQASAEMVAIAGRLAAQYPADVGWSVKVMSLLEYNVRSIKPALLILLAAVAFVLLIACVNVANLLLSRAAGRTKEIAIRSALGAGRGRIIRQLLTESMLLALLGGAAGLALAKWGLDLLLMFAPENLPRMSQVSLDGRIFGFTALLTLLTGVLFGLVPALQASNPNLNETMKDGGRGSTEGGRGKLIRNSLVVLEVSTALVLLIGAGLMIKSFWRLQQINPGFNLQNTMTATVALPRRKYADEKQQAAFFERLLEKVQHLPGVQSAGATSLLPLSNNDSIAGFEIQDRPPLPPGAGQSTLFYRVSEGYFKAMGIPLIRGRLLDYRDTADSAHVAVINETMAKKIFPNEEPIGKRITFGSRESSLNWYEIVGIVGDVRHYSLDQPATLQTYEPFRQQTTPTMSLVVRATGDPASLGAAIRNQVQELDPEQPIANLKTLDSLAATSTAQRAFSMTLLSVFAAVALVLASIGIYGVLSYAVNQRTHEIGVRMALGAGRRDVLKMVVAQGMSLILLGSAIGLIAAYGLTRVMSSLLFDVSATDPLIFGLIALLLIAVALFACYIPARRATKVDPLIALRCD
jgi:putative ABC transport system permease protein